MKVFFIKFVYLWLIRSIKLLNIKLILFYLFENFIYLIYLKKRGKHQYENTVNKNAKLRHILYKKQNVDE